jgi:hypothetical protein
LIRLKKRSTRFLWRYTQLKKAKLPLRIELGMLAQAPRWAASARMALVS